MRKAALVAPMHGEDKARVLGDTLGHGARTPWRGVMGGEQTTLG
jgi:hypothetical protein